MMRTGQKSKRAIRQAILAGVLTALITVFLPVPALSAVTAQLDRDRVYTGDQITLIIQADGPASAEPDLSPLDKNFNVLGTGKSSQVSIINGHRSDKTNWTVKLEARQTGKISIPPIKVGAEHTQALELEVTEVPEQVAAQLSRHLFLEVEKVGKGKVYVQQQIPYNVRLYYDDRVLSGELGAPQPEDAVVEQLGEDKQFTATRNNQKYNVVERHYAISPEKSGTMRIPPISFKGKLKSSQKPYARRSRQGSMIDRFFSNSPFANDPFFSNSLLVNPGKTVRIHSKAMTVEVQPRPATAGKDWLPAEQIILLDSWADEPPQFRVGEPVTRTITLQAIGLTGAQVPALQLQQPEKTRLYPESPVNTSRTDGSQVYAISEQKFTYIPNQAGELTVPAFELSWWNTRTDQQASTRLARRVYPVEAGNASPQLQPADEEEEENISTGEKARALPTTQEPESGVLQPTGFKAWLIAGAVLLLLMLILFIIRRLRAATSGKRQTAPAQPHRRTAIKKLLQQLEHACHSNNARAAADTLMELARLQWPDDPPRNLGSLAQRLGQGYQQIMELDRSLYSPVASNWEGAGLCSQVRNAWQKKPAAEKSADVFLKPLYPHRR